MLTIHVTSLFFLPIVQIISILEGPTHILYLLWCISWMFHLAIISICLKFNNKYFTSHWYYMVIIVISYYVCVFFPHLAQRLFECRDLCINLFSQDSILDAYLINKSTTSVLICSHVDYPIQNWHLF